MPLPLNRQVFRSLCVAWANLGNHPNGAMIVRPSSRSTISSSAFAVALTARALGKSLIKELIPFPHQLILMVVDDLLDPIQFFSGKSAVAFQSRRRQPEFRFLVVAPHVHAAVLRYRPQRKIVDKDQCEAPSALRHLNDDYFGALNCGMNASMAAFSFASMSPATFLSLSLMIMSRTSARCSFMKRRNCDSHSDT